MDMRETLKHDLGERIRIWWDYDQEDIEGSFDLGDEKENANYLKKFRTGENLSLNLEVEYWDHSGNVSGNDCLGSCHFAAKNLDAQILDTVKEYGMVDNARNEMDRIVREIRNANEVF